MRRSSKMTVSVIKQNNNHKTKLIKVQNKSHYRQSYILHISDDSNCRFCICISKDWNCIPLDNITTWYMYQSCPCTWHVQLFCWLPPSAASLYQMLSCKTICHKSRAEHDLDVMHGNVFMLEGLHWCGMELHTSISNLKFVPKYYLTF